MRSNSIDTMESIVTWKGSMLLASQEEHTGYVHISKGELMIEKGQLVGGTVEIDMNTIEYKDKENKNSPIKHLKSPDFFDVQKFPISTFAKGVTNAVTFPAQMEVKGGIVKANGKVIIDSTFRRAGFVFPSAYTVTLLNN